MHFTQTHWKHTRETDFFCLNSERVLTIRNIIPMISSDCIIKIVEDWGKKNKKREIQEGHRDMKQEQGTF